MFNQWYASYTIVPTKYLVSPAHNLDGNDPISAWYRAWTGFQRLQLISKLYLSLLKPEINMMAQWSADLFAFFLLIFNYIFQNNKKIIVVSSIHRFKFNMHLPQYNQAYLGNLPM